MRQDIKPEERQQAADRLMTHLLQKGGRPAPYKERLIGGFANPATGRMPQAVLPIVDPTPLGFLQRLVFAVEGWIRRRAEPDRQKMPGGAKQTQ